MLDLAGCSTLVFCAIILCGVFRCCLCSRRFGRCLFDWRGFNGCSFCWCSFNWRISSSNSRFDRCLSSPASITACCHHFSLQPVKDSGLCKFAIERDRAHRIVIARNDIINTIRGGVRINNGDDRNVETVSLFNSNGFLVGIDHEQHVRKTAHFLDPAKGQLQLVPLTRQLQHFLLGQLANFLAFHTSFKLTQTTD